MHALLLSHTLEVGTQEFLELVSLNGKPFGLKQPHMFHAVDHDPWRRPELQIGLAIEVALSVPSQPDESGIVTALGVGALARIQSQGLDLQVLGPGFEPEARVVEVAAGR
jgi:hypothetical protein